MSTPQQELSRRLRELRRRHFGPRGKDEFARRLGLDRAQYDTYEEGTLPPGELMVRICDVTGEDLQWLLTGVSSRGAVVISGARRRHQDLLTRIARALDNEPKLAAPLEAFFDLLLHDGTIRNCPPAAELPESNAALLPVFDGAWPEELPDPDDPDGGVRALAVRAPQAALERATRATALLIEPAPDGHAPALRRVDVIATADRNGQSARFLENAELARWFPRAFGLALHDDGMKPMFAAGDVLLVAPGATPQLGRPAACKFRDPARNCCGIWLGEQNGQIQLGRLADGRHEELPRERLCWALEVLYRLTPAA
jgi:hypothetical protein